MINASADLFDAITLEYMARRFEFVLTQLIDKPEQPLLSLSILLPHEIKLLEPFDAINQLSVDYMRKNDEILLIHEQFATRADEHPQKVAVILDDQFLSYAELLHSSQFFANYLIEVVGVKSEDIVVQCVEKSIEMVRYRKNNSG